MALAAAFFVVLPLQYFLVWIEWYGLYSIFIPVYAFLLLPIIAALRGDTTHFMTRVAEDAVGPDDLRVLPLARAGAARRSTIPGYEGRNLLLIAFLVLVVQSSDVLQYVWGKLFGRHKIAPALSPSKTVEGFVGGVRQRHRCSARRCGGSRRSRRGRRALMALVDHADGLLRRPRDVGDQARPRRQGLGPA